MTTNSEWSRRRRVQPVKTIMELLGDQQKIRTGRAHAQYIIMMIIDKKDNLKTLYSLGTTVKDIKKIFVLQGFLLTIFGMIIGLLIGIILVFLQQKFSLFMITQEKLNLSI